MQSSATKVPFFPGRKGDKGTDTKPFQLPVRDVPTFTGRETELKRLKEILIDSREPSGNTVCCITGAGGVGKSALAGHFAEKYKDSFPHGVIGLRVDRKDSDTIARELAASLGIEIQDSDERSASAIVKTLFSHRSMLLYFDGVERADSIAALRPGGRTCAVLMTTRNYHLAEELGIDHDDCIDLPVLPPDDAFTLLEKYLGPEQVQTDPEAVKELAASVGYLPLALEITGNHIKRNPEQSLSKYALTVRREKENLKPLETDADSPLTVNVRAAFSLSYGSLPDRTAAFFSCLSVCAAEGFSLNAAAAAGDLGEEETGTLLRELVDRALLSHPSRQEKRYCIHPLLRPFAVEELDKNGNPQETAQRHALYFVHLVKSNRMSQEKKAAMVAEEMHDIVLAARWLKAHKRTDYEFLKALEPFFLRLGFWETASELMTGFLELASMKEDWHAMVQLGIQRAKFLSLLGRYPQAREALLNLKDYVEHISNETSRQRSEAMWLNTLGGVLQRMGKFDDAADVFRRSAGLEEKLGNERGQAIVQNSLGSVLQRMGRFEDAVDAFRTSYGMEEKLNNLRGQAVVLNSMGSVLRRLGRFDEAVTAFEKSIEVGHVLKDSHHIAMAQNSLGGVLQRLGKCNQAVEAFEESYDLLMRMNDLRGQAMVQNSLGSVLQRMGRFDEAIVAFKKSIELGEWLNDRRHLAMALNSMGGVLQRMGQFDEAVDAFEGSFSLLMKLKDERGQAMVLNSLGGVLQRMGKYDEAVENFEQGYKLLVKLNDRRGQAMVLNSLGSVLKRMGKMDEAVSSFKRSIDVGRALKDRRHIAMVQNSLGGALQQLKQYEEAVAAFKSSYEVELELGNERGQAMVQNSMGNALQRMGRLKEAIKSFEESVAIGEKLRDKLHLSMVYTAYGRTLLYHRVDAVKALELLSKGFEINMKLKNKRGLEIVTPVLIQALLDAGRRHDARDCFARAIKLLPRSKRILSMKPNFV